MVQRGRFYGKKMLDDDFPDSNMGLYEPCAEAQCGKPMDETCQCGKRYCRRHMKIHQRKTHRSATKP